MERLHELQQTRLARISQCVPSISLKEHSLPFPLTQSQVLLQAGVVGGGSLQMRFVLELLGLQLLQVGTCISCQEGAEMPKQLGEEHYWLLGMTLQWGSFHFAATHCPWPHALKFLPERSIKRIKGQVKEKWITQFHQKQL